MVVWRNQDKAQPRNSASTPRSPFPNSQGGREGGRETPSDCRRRDAGVGGRAQEGGLVWACVGRLLAARRVPSAARRAAFGAQGGPRPRARAFTPRPQLARVSPRGSSPARRRLFLSAPGLRQVESGGVPIQMQKFLQLFGRLKSVVLGMVHVRALPGTPCATLPLAQIIEAACGEAEMYRAAGVDGLIVENMHDRPYTFDVGAEVTAAMAVICASVKRACPTLPIGVQILCAANQEALAVALASGADFVRVEGFVFSHVADEGILNACAGNLLRYRKQIGAEHIQVFADIKKKHSAHALTADVTVAETAKAAEFFLADGVVLTGTATGSEADPKELEEVRSAVKIPVLVGSGVTLDNVKDYLSANALIIGSYFKKDGYWANGIDLERVKRFLDYIGQVRV